MTKLPCLSGTDVNKYPTSLWVTTDSSGSLRDAQTGGVLSVTDGGVLMGWGDLDGPSYLVGSVNVPKRALDRLLAGKGGGA